MATIEVKATVPLQEAIILATQEELEYSELEMQTASGPVWIGLAVPKDLAQRMWESREQWKNYWVNTKVEKLLIRLIVADISEEEMMRLEGRHPQAAWYTSSIGKYQEAEELGERIRTIIVNSCNSLLRWLQTKYGQFWLKRFSLEEPAQNFLTKVRAEWRVPTAGVWMPLNTYPHTSLIRGLAIRSSFSIS
jgi:hypothetical protein